MHDGFEIFSGPEHKRVDTHVTLEAIVSFFPLQRHHLSYRFLPFGIPQRLEGFMVRSRLLDILSNVIDVNHFACDWWY